MPSAPDKASPCSLFLLWTFHKGPIVCCSSGWTPIECRFSYECPTNFEPIAACIDWDPELRLLALGTKGGALRVFGAPGVELLGQHEGEELTVLRFILRHSYSKQLLDTIRLDCLRL